MKSTNLKHWKTLTSWIIFITTLSWSPSFAETDPFPSASKIPVFPLKKNESNISKGASQKTGEPSSEKKFLITPSPGEKPVAAKNQPPVNLTKEGFISSNNQVTSSSEVFLSISASDQDNDLTGYYASESEKPPSSDTTAWTPLKEKTGLFTQKIPFTLGAGNGEKTVFVWFKDSGGNISAPKSDSILKFVFKNLPDTGQTRKFTGSFFLGEDSDYTIHPMGFVDNKDGTVIDKQTGLFWQNSIGSSQMTWADAMNYCNTLYFGEKNLSDWRLPTLLELLSIVDYSEDNPSISKKFFPGTRPDFYWSSTQYAPFNKMAWYVDFRFGTAGYYRFKTNKYYVRCVHNAPNP
ncbi:MAG: DUF1566 domain-containing protein [Nitrospinota bacterium]